MPRQAGNVHSSALRYTSRYSLTFSDHGMDASGITLGSVLRALFVHVDTGERAPGELEQGQQVLCDCQTFEEQ